MPNSNEATSAGVYTHGTKKNLIFSLWQNTTVFQAEIYNIKACATETTQRP